MGSTNRKFRINKIKTQLIITNVIILFLIGFLSSVFISNVNSMNADIYAKAFSWIGWFLLTWCVWSWYRLRNELLCPYIIFILIAFIFMFGQSLLLAFDILPEQRDIRRMFSILNIAQAQVFTIMGLGCFHLGALLSARGEPQHIEFEINQYRSDRISIQAIKTVGWILFLVSILPFINNLINTLKIVVTSGYGGLYDSSLVTTGLNLNRLSNFIGELFILGLFCLLIVYRRTPFMRNAIVLLILLQILSSLYIGGRSPILVMIACFLCIWHYCIKRITVKRAGILLVLAYFLISMLSVVANLRGMADRDLLLYVTVFLESFGKENLFILTIAEMGWSMSPLVWVMNLVPSHFDFLNGSSYLYAFTTIIPNLGFWDIHPGSLHANLGHWLQATLSLNYGPGFSPVAEAYINFGWGGTGALLLLGSFYGYVFSSIHRDTAMNNLVRVCVIFILLSLTLMTNRNSFLATIRAVFYYALPIYLFFQLIRNYLIQQTVFKKRKNKAEISYDFSSRSMEDV